MALILDGPASFRRNSWLAWALDGSLLAILNYSFLISCRALTRTAVAQNTGTQAPNPVSDKAAKAEAKKVKEGEAYAKAYLVLMDKDKSGKVSKEEFMAFMAAEFDMLDIN